MECHDKLSGLIIVIDLTQDHLLEKITIVCHDYKFFEINKLTGFIFRRIFLQSN